MSVNSSSSDFYCFTSNIGISTIIYFLLTKMIVVLFLSIPIFYVCYQQWQQGTSYSGIITYNVIAIQLIFVLGTTVTLCGLHASCFVMVIVGMNAVSFTFPGEIFFNIATCVEHYLAVVHPITYLGLRQSGGIRIRNICIACGWLLCFGWLGVEALYYLTVPYIPYVCVTVASLIIVSFCCISLRCVLIHPGPGEMGADGKKIGQSKQKAFYTITAIMVVLLYI